MVVREATLEDKEAWDSFVDNQNGDFFLYFDWKHVHKTANRHFIPLLVETNPSQLVGIFSIIKEKRLLYSTLSGRFLLSSDLSKENKNEILSALLLHIDANYSKSCSTFNVVENSSLDGKLIEEPLTALINNGFRFLNDKSTLLPCAYALKLKQPFEETIWKGLWAHKLRQNVRNAERNGVVIVEDRGLKYADEFIKMHADVRKRHSAKPVTKKEIMSQLNVFREKSKLFVALQEGQPIVALLCCYTSSTCYLWEIGTPQKNTDHANKLCYKAAIEDACNTGYKYVDFGGTPTPSLAVFKERFGATRIPWLTYEKRYSFVKTLIEKTPIVIRHTYQNKGYIWNNRHKLWDRIVHG